MNHWRARHIRRPPGLCAPGYRYCGPGCSGPGVPVNDVDNCCRIHDACYAKYGPSKKCDAEFLACLRTKINPATKKGRDARFFYNIIRLKSGL
ncbi:Parvovirus coat protein VP1-like protein [Aquibacillus salsiterrae]|uniref:Parvovirus coat protein VP1-like protein n=1 Tax=Aquibacillus salsiterrae TaxID=2950439 RepID=A0A9X3WE62_9BACI|nr:Parvovirus coat protein VP1-like protein [Aquibacillus salsiterrae]MDC3417373.1 Parvovirus coat protein VP1-like protein [Aquibacillus salsiterrae]